MSWSDYSKDDDYKIKVSGDYCKDNEERTDYLIIDRDTGEKKHISIDAYGEMKEWHDFR